MTLVPGLRNHGSNKGESVTQAPGLKCYLDNRSNSMCLSYACVPMQLTHIFLG
jgi:hypothetical protein